MRPTQRTLALVTWIVAGCFLAVGVERVPFRDARLLATVDSDAAALQGKIARAEGILHDRKALSAARQDIVNDIRAQAAYDSGSDLGPMLAALDRAARTSGLAIVGIEPDGGAQPAADRWLRARNVKVLLRGRYGGMMAFLMAFSARDPLVEWRDVTIAPAGSAADPRDLVATFRALAYSVHISGAKE